MSEEDERLAKKERVIETHLRTASEFLLPSVPQQALVAFWERHGREEWVKAMDELAAVAAAHGARTGIWRRLRQVAEEVGLPQKAGEYEQRFQKALGSDK